MKSKLLLSFAVVLSLTACSNQPKTCQDSKDLLVKDAGAAVKMFDFYGKMMFSLASSFGGPKINKDDHLAVFLDITDIQERSGEKNKDTVCLCSAKIQINAKNPETSKVVTRKLDFDYSLKKDEHGKKTIVDVDAFDIFGKIIKDMPDF